MGFCLGGQSSLAWETWKLSICVQTSLKRGVAKKFIRRIWLFQMMTFQNDCMVQGKKLKVVGHCHGEITSFLFSWNYLPSCECFYQRGVGGRKHCRIKAYHTLEFIALLKRIRLFSNRGIGTSTGKTCAVVQLVTAVQR